MTYIVSGGALNSTHSLRAAYAYAVRLKITVRKVTESLEYQCTVLCLL